jgi:hypothetical protein
VTPFSWNERAIQLRVERFPDSPWASIDAFFIECFINISRGIIFIFILISTRKELESNIISIYYKYELLPAAGYGNVNEHTIVHE